MSAPPICDALISAENLRANILRAIGLGCTSVDVSGDAFGHGAVMVANAALDSGAIGVYVGALDEALSLREAGFAGPIECDAVPDDRTFEASSASISQRSTGISARDSIYGFDGVSAPVMTLRSRVIMTKSIVTGDGVSYGYTFRAPANGNTALVGLGYGEGIHRRAGNLCTAQLNGREYPIVGRVAMNAFVLYLGADEATVGDPVILFGDVSLGHPTLMDWARRIGELPSTVTATLSARVVRILS